MYYPSVEIMYQRYVRECEKSGIEPMTRDEYLNILIDKKEEK